MRSYQVALTSSAEKEIRALFMNDTAKTVDVTRIAHRREVYE